MRRVTLSSLLAIVLLLAVSASSVMAAPVNNPHAEFYTLECDNGSEYDIVVTFGMPAHILGSTSMLIPHQFTWALVVDGQPVFEDTELRGQRLGVQARLIDCHLTFELSEEEIAELEAELGLDLSESEVVAHLTVRAMVTPARR